MFKSLFSLIAALSIISQVALGAMGTESGGGGDADAVDFLSKIRAVALWSSDKSSSLKYEDSQRILSVAQIISQKMDLASETPIVMVDKNLVDASGASKVALYDLNKFKITVTRNKWKKLSEEDKFVTAALELYGLAGVQDRYVQAAYVQKDAAIVKQYPFARPEDWRIENWKNAGKEEDFGVYLGVDSANHQCRVILDEAPGDYRPGGINRYVIAEFTDLKFELYFDKVIHGQGQMPRNSLGYFYNEQGKKVWVVKDLNYHSSFFFGGKSGWAIRRTLNAEAKLDTRNAQKITISSKRQTFECKNLKALSALGTVSLLLPEIEALVKKAFAAQEKFSCSDDCDERNSAWNDIQTHLRQAKQRLSKGDGAGATASLIRLNSSVFSAYENEAVDATTKEFMSLFNYFTSNNSILTHLKN